jgi:RND family efflux transporter MFP subunit
MYMEKYFNKKTNLFKANAMTKSINSLLAIASVILIWLSSCNNGKQPAEGSENMENLPSDIVELRDDQVKLAGIEYGKIEIHQVSKSIRVNGKVSVAPGNMASVCMPMGGFIKYTYFMTGDEVQKGQVLAVIENQDFVDIQQNFLEARNKLAFAEADFKRHSELYNNDVYSEKNLQEVTVEYKNLKATVKSLEQKLLIIGLDPSGLTEDNISSSVNLVSPISGFLRAVNINIGKYVTPTDVLFEVVNNEKLFLELSLFEKDADKIVPGQKVIFFINNETEEHSAIVTHTGKSIGNDNTLLIYASVDNTCKNVLPGMYVNAVITESHKDVPALPSDAIVSFDDKEYIFIYEREKEESGKPFTEYKIVEVRKGVSSSGFTEISLPEDLDIATVKVVIKGAYNLLSAMKNAGEMAC